MPDLPPDPTAGQPADAAGPLVASEDDAVESGRLRRVRDWFGEASWPRRIAAGVLAPLLGLAGLIVVAGWSDEVLALTGEIVFGVDELPALDSPNERTTVLDRHGEVIGVLTGPENRISVPLDELPDHLTAAVLASEDQHFVDHEGVSVSGILRAAVKNVLGGGIEQGGSTITQQYVKNALLTSERSFRRKITEATWAIRLEDRLTKDEILQGYLDIIYLGDGTYGVGAAANHWFGKDARELTLADSALLAGMIRAPEAVHPGREPDAARARRDVVLGQMLGLDMITEEEATAARAMTVDEQLDITQLIVEGEEHGHVLEFVKQTLLDDDVLGPTRDERSAMLFGGGLRITTTLDLELVNLAEQTLAAHLTDPIEDPMGGIVSVEPSTGSVRAMAVGPKGFGPCEEGNDCATTTVNPLVPGMGSPGRQVGSAFKPIVTAAALAAGTRTDWHTIIDSGQAIPGCGNYRPQNYDGADGVRDMAGALSESNNVFHVKLGVDTGLEDVVALAGDLGVTNALEPNCSLALGSAEIHPLDMASVYATFANGGIHCAVRVVDRIEDRNGTSLPIPSPACRRVLDEDVADQVTTMLRGVVEGGTARRAAIGRSVAAKTGTTNDNLDAWLVGFTPELATATWMGFEVPKPMTGILDFRSISGGTLPAIMWAEFMKGALDGVEPGDLPRSRIARYAMPDCPPPPARTSPSPTPEPDAVASPAAQQATPTQGPSEAASPESGNPYEGFSPQDGTLLTEVDGDDFASGHQPERCVMSAPPEAYGPTGGPEPSDGPSEPSPEPSESVAEEPAPSDSPSEPSDEPSEPLPTDPAPGAT